MKKEVILFSLLVFSLFVSAESYDGYQDLTLDFNMKSELFLATQNNPRLDSLKVELKLAPVENERQNIISFDAISNPEAEIKSNGVYTYTWDEINPSYEYGINARVKVRNQMNQVKSKIKFPNDVGEEFDEYLRESNFIDFNDKIKNKANEIVQGEDDYYRAVFKVADWVQNNVDYDLNTITAKAVQKSSWVLDNKEGVCDELTNLFISMLRMTGIPARFVTGTVYAGDSVGWGNHGWAEVYFPDKGWVPWDVTFGQHGWVDPTHLKLSDTVDSGESSVEYSWRSLNLDVQAGNLELVTKLEKKGDRFPNFVNLNVKPLKEKLRFGSYLPIEVVVENKQDFYLGTTVVLYKGPTVEDNTLAVLLAPKEIRSVFWIAKIPDDLSEDFVYTSELEARDTFNSISRTKVFYAKNGAFLSREEALDKVESLKKRDEKQIFVGLNVDCDYLDREYKSDEKIDISCSVFNRGTGALNNVNICLDNDCSVGNFGIGEKREFVYSLGVREGYLFSVENEEFVKKLNLDLDVIKIPEVYVTEIFPKKVGYGVQTEVSFDANSDFKVYDLILDINGVGAFEIEELEGKRPMQFNVNSKKLVSGLNMEISYKDGSGEAHAIEKTYPLIVQNIPFYAKIWEDIKGIFW